MNPSWNWERLRDFFLALPSLTGVAPNVGLPRRLTQQKSFLLPFQGCCTPENYHKTVELCTNEWVSMYFMISYGKIGDVPKSSFFLFFRRCSPGFFRMLFFVAKSWPLRWFQPFGPYPADTRKRKDFCWRTMNQKRNQWFIKLGLPWKKSSPEIADELNSYSNIKSYIDFTNLDFHEITWKCRWDVVFFGFSIHFQLMNPVSQNQPTKDPLLWCFSGLIYLTLEKWSGGLDSERDFLYERDRHLG